MSGTDAYSTQHRIRAIDAARGSAMLFVFFSHFVEVFFKRYGMPLTVAYDITQIASPTFMCISGVMLGILYITRQGKFQDTKSSFIRRGIFLLTIGRALIFIAHIPFAGGWQQALRWGFMTDTIGVCIIVGPLLMERINYKARAAIGVITYVCAWVLIFTWFPTRLSGLAIKELLVGSLDPPHRFFTDVFPVLPWLGVYLTSTSIGELWGESIVKNGTEKITTMARQLGVAGVLSAALLFGLRYILRHMIQPHGLENWQMLLTPELKLPPGIVYIMFYGGSAFLLLFLLLKYRNIRMVEKLSRALEILGRNSLFVFIVQYGIYFALFPILSFPSAAVWPGVFLISAMAIWGLAYACDRAGYSKYLTVPRLHPG
jgi:uncharacterized membrane protein